MDRHQRTTDRRAFRRRSLTAEQRCALARLRELAAARRLRVTRDAEGWPLIPGRLGRIEDNGGPELAVYTARPRLFVRLWAIPGARRWQTGDGELRALFPAEALPAVARVIRARVRRQGGASPEALARARAARPAVVEALLTTTSGAQNTPSTALPILVGGVLLESGRQPVVTAAPV
jgi:hypothetical protein